jgi:hypothetical protein
MGNVETSASISSWGDTVFGSVARNMALVDRAMEELTELQSAVQRGENEQIIASEAADVAILLHRLVGGLGEDLYDHIDNKMKINRSRKWKLCGNGTGIHIDEK